MAVQGPRYQDISNKMRQLQGTIILETNFIHIYVLKYIFLSSNILSISLHITVWKMRNLNKSNVLTTIESINRTLKKCWENNFKNTGTILVCTQFRKSRKFFFCSVIQRIMCFIFISEQTATCATYITNWLIFIIEMQSVYSAVRTGSLNKAVCHPSLKG